MCQVGLFRCLLYSCVFLLLVTSASAAALSGVVKDPAGNPKPGASVEISSPVLAAPIVVETDGQGGFALSDAKPGFYRLRVSAEGFATITQSVDLSSGSIEPVLISLQLAPLRQEVTVEGKVSAHANNDPIYRQFRGVSTGVTFDVANFDFGLDVGRLHLGPGTLTFLQPVNGYVTGAVYVGRGHFSLKPVDPIDRHELERRSGNAELEEDFSTAVFRYSGNFNTALIAAGNPRANPEPAAASLFSHWAQRVRQRHDPAVSFADNLLYGSEMDNWDAEVLSWLYNPVMERAFFVADIHGDKHKELRFTFRARGGAIPSLGSPEEVGLINVAPESLEDGIWYLSHTQREIAESRASSRQDRRFVLPHKFKIETVIGGNDHLTSIATVTFEPVVAGERVVRFNLLPNLRVTRVSGLDRAEISYIQESRKADGSFYAILPTPMELNKEYALTIEYAGDKVVNKAGNGSFYIGARTAWYPDLNGFLDRANYDLTFRVPKSYHVISVGHLEGESIEEGQDVTHWVTSVPIFVAGFNYGEYQRTNLHDDQTGIDIGGYYLPNLPDMLAHAEAAQSIAPRKMTEYALSQTRAELQLGTYMFGKLPFNNVYITEQPNFSFGQSWPNLVYLPISAYLDSTQRYMLLGGISNSLTAFVTEVTPHEVAHQWWGHTVAWASYRDQWLSEGFAEFSAGVFLQQAVGPKWQKDYIDFWERLRKRILEKNKFGVAPNDAGPLWLGLRLDSPRTEGAYFSVVYPKGAYVLSMIRSLFYATKEHDQPFIDMMHDFVDAHRDKAASTESFKAIVEKHMPAGIDVEKNGRLDWFFRQWVYGTEVPHYDFQYQSAAGSEGKTKIHMTVTQSAVSDHFVMFVPLFADFGRGNGMVRIGQLPIVGNSVKSFDFDFTDAPKKLALNAYKEILER